MEAILAALTNIDANPLRSFLTTIGIVAGIAAVMIVIAIGEGNREVIQHRIKLMGANLLVLNLQGLDAEMGQIKMGAPVFVDEKAIAVLKKRIAAIDAISPLLATESEFKYQSFSSKALVNGTYPEYERIRHLALMAGRYFSSFEEQNEKRVCVLTESAAKKLGGISRELLNKEVYVDGRKYAVVGIVKDLPLLNKGMKAEQIFIPYSTMKKDSLFGFLDTVYLTIKETEDMEDGIKQTNMVLRQLYGAASKGWVKDMADLLKNEKAITANTTLMIVGVASLSLFVGGIGVMNILLVSVKERVREIGIRKAIGATDHDILGQFLLEGVLLCTLGGMAGIILGIVSVQFIASIMDIPVKISFMAIAMALVFSTGVGIFFSLYPAMDAAKLSPVEALRYE